MNEHSPLYIGRTFHLQLLLALIALELLMSFSFLGYFHIGQLSFTLSYIPVLLAGCLLGPVDSTILGMTFGLASLWKASASYVGAGDRIFSPFLSGEPFSSLLLSVGSRMLFGAVIGLLYWAAKRSSKRPVFWISLISLFGKNIHSFCVYAAMGALFPELGYGISNTFQRYWALSNWGTMLLTAAVVVIGWKIWCSPTLRQYQEYLSVLKNDGTEQKDLKSLTAVAGFALILAGAIGYYFVNRMNYMFGVHGVEVTDSVRYDLLHLQIQFLLGIIALSILVFFILTFIRSHVAYQLHEANKDPLTGLLNRKGFYRIYRSLSDNLEFSPDSPRYFLILDVDHFKQINDLNGHPVGDRVLQEIAELLKDAFREIGKIGRLGGDEFVAFVHTPLPREIFETLMQHLLNKIRKIECGGQRVSCSIGSVLVTERASEEVLYRQADEALYEAKQRGRDQYILK